MHTEGHDMGKPEGVPSHATQKRDSEHPGYETQDVNVGNIITFLAGLTGFVVVFFVFCFVMGKVVNHEMLREDGTPAKYSSQNLSQVGVKPGERENLASNAEMQQRQLQQVTQSFPTPVLQTDDGNSDTAEMHAREDLLLENYSKSSDLPAGTVRIPIEDAMKLVVAQGLPKAPAPAGTEKLMAGDSVPTIHAPLTNGFARTGYELQQIEAREQRLAYGKAEEKK